MLNIASVGTEWNINNNYIKMHMPYSNADISDPAMLRCQ